MLIHRKQVVSDDRKKETIKSCENGWFGCHKSTIEGGEQQCCRGYYDEHLKILPHVSYAIRRRIITFVDGV